MQKSPTLNQVSFATTKAISTLMPACVGRSVILKFTIRPIANTVLQLYRNENPFPDYRQPAVVIPRLVLGGQRPDRGKPVKAGVVNSREIPDNIWNIMQQCWAQEPASRPKASALLQDLLAVEQARQFALYASWQEQATWPMEDNESAQTYVVSPFVTPTSAKFAHG